MCRRKAVLGRLRLANASGYGKRFGPTRRFARCAYFWSGERQKASVSIETENKRIRPAVGCVGLRNSEYMKTLTALHLNSMLTGGGTDDRSVRIAPALSKLGHTIWLAGPARREVSEIAQQL